jgi:hypothetical protein
VLLEASVASRAASRTRPRESAGRIARRARRAHAPPSSQVPGAQRAAHARVAHGHGRPRGPVDARRPLGRVRVAPGRKRVIQRLFNVRVPRADVPGKASTRRERSER